MQYIKESLNKMRGCNLILKINQYHILVIGFLFAKFSISIYLSSIKIFFSFFGSSMNDFQ